MSKGLQDTYKEDMQGQSYKLSKGAESEREKSTKRLAFLLYTFLNLTYLSL
jgi:hypothetical protein